MRRPVLMCLTASLLVGCAAKKNAVRPAYYGPTDPLPTLVDKLNERNGRLQSLRAEGRFSADLIDPVTKDRTSPPDGDVTLLYMPPRNLRLAAKVFTERAFDIGSNSDRYWLILPRQETMYWGTHGSDTGQAARLPIRPDLLVEVLGITPLETDLLQSPAPVLRFNNDQDCYMLTWQVRLPDRFAVQKEVWYDRQTLQPRLVLLFDVNGRVVLRAYPSDVKKVHGYDPPVEMPSRYELMFPDMQSTFSLRLSDLERERNGVPAARSFVFPERPAGVSKVEPLDR
ncbi:MAG TPA: hypothetical protein VF595_07145 [Tepidisphaeraceae bacterium]|jgi:hypothetical protein